jgi:phenylpropionate dioxygenase-like ring-hydroxylating dioxygenase large terminal subunit
VEAKTGDVVYKIEKPEEHEKQKPGRKKKWAHVKKVKLKPKGEKSRQMNEFMQQICDCYPNDHIILACDNAWWHKSQYTKVPERMTVIYIPPYTPEMNPIEQFWREVRTAGFANKCLKTINAVVDNLHNTIASILPKTIRSIFGRDWILKLLN